MCVVSALIGSTTSHSLSLQSASNHTYSESVRDKGLKMIDVMKELMMMQW